MPSPLLQASSPPPFPLPLRVPNAVVLSAVKRRNHVKERKRKYAKSFQSEVGEVFGEIGGELPAKFGRRFLSFCCWGKSSEAFSTKTPPQISPSNFTTRFWVVAGPTKAGKSCCSHSSAPRCGSGRKCQNFASTTLRTGTPSRTPAGPPPPGASRKESGGVGGKREELGLEGRVAFFIFLAFFCFAIFLAFFQETSDFDPWPQYFWKVSRYTSHFYRDTFAQVCPPPGRK